MRYGFGLVALLALGLTSFGIVTGTLLHVESRDGFCVGCHLHMAKNDAMHSAPREVGQLAALHFAKGIGCAECHRAPGRFGRVIALYTLGLRDSARYLFADYHEPRRLAYPLSNALCAECHAETLVRAGTLDTYHGNTRHNARQDIRCTTCHVHHARGDPGYAYLEMRAFEAGCVSCHHGLYDAAPAQRLAPATGELSETRAALKRRGVELP